MKQDPIGATPQYPDKWSWVGLVGFLLGCSIMVFGPWGDWKIIGWIITIISMLLVTAHQFDSPETKG